MTQAEFVQSLKNNHPFFNQQALSSQIKQVEMQATRANEEWIIDLNGNYKDEDQSDVFRVSSKIDSSGVESIISEIISPPYFDQLKETEIKFSVKKKLVDTGSSIIIEHSWVDANRNKDVLDTTSNSFTIGYIYPLLRNKGGINDRLLGDIAQISIDKDSLERSEQEEFFILEKSKLFIDLILYQEQQSIHERRLSLAKQELTLVQEKFAASVVDKVDVLLQEDAYQKANQQLLQAQQDLTVLRHEIAITLGVDFDQVTTTTDLYRLYKLDVQHNKKQLLAKARVLKITDLELKILKRQLASFKNESQAQLDLNLGLGRTGLNTNYSNALSDQSTSWNIGLGLSYPLGGIKSSSNITKAQIKIQRLMQYKQEQSLDLSIAITTLREKIILLSELLKSNQKQIMIAKDRTTEEKSQYANGNGKASFVISAQNNEQNAQLGYAQVATNYQKAVLEYKATLDILAP
jgi:outer membrane protein TolC